MGGPVDPEGRVTVGVDVGGTKILAVAIGSASDPVPNSGSVDPGSEAVPAPAPDLLRSRAVPMPGRTVPEAMLEEAIAAAVRGIVGSDRVDAVGLSVAGLVDAAGERLRFAAHLPWREAPVRSRIADLLGIEVVMDNDANCAAHAELVAGAARAAPSALLVTIGTGIGGALMLGGRVVRGAHGTAGEFGHMQVVPDGLQCECGLRGCWEQYCSGRALERVMRVAVGRHHDGREVSARARAGDEVALRAIASIGTWLGVGVAGLVSAFDPALVVIGGGVSADGDLLLEPARTALAESLQGADHRVIPPLVPAHFGPEAGAVGAALLARDRTTG